MQLQCNWSTPRCPRPGSGLGYCGCGLPAATVAAAAVAAVSAAVAAAAVAADWRRWWIRLLRLWDNSLFSAPAASEWARLGAAEPSKREKISHLGSSVEPHGPNRLHQLALGIQLASQFPIQVDAREVSGGGWPLKVGPKWPPQALHPAA